MSGSGPEQRRDADNSADANDDVGAGRVADAIEELYGGDPQEFTRRRGELATEARSAGDAVAAKAIAGLRRPTRAAWVINRLARSVPSAPAQLAELGAALRAAQEARQGPRLRELSAARGPLIDALTDQALAAGGLPDPPAALRAEVAATLSAALADPTVAAGFAAGTLTSSAHWAGFGTLELSPAFDTEDEAIDDTARPVPARGRRQEQDLGASDVSAPNRPRDGEGTGGGRARATTPAPKRRGTREPSAGDELAAARARQQEEAERLAEEVAERAARRRKTHEDAERTLASSAAAAAAAVAEEDRLEAEVHDLEHRLTRARAELAAARMRARHAEAAERRARQIFERLPRESD